MNQSKVTNLMIKLKFSGMTLHGSSEIWLFISTGMANLNKDTFTVDELKKALKNFKVNADDVQDDKVCESLEHFATILKIDIFGV